MELHDGIGSGGASIDPLYCIAAVPSASAVDCLPSDAAAAAIVGRSSMARNHRTASTEFAVGRLFQYPIEFVVLTLLHRHLLLTGTISLLLLPQLDSRPSFSYY